MKTIYIACLAHRHTGGLTLAHQLCYKLKSLGYNAKMYYYFNRKHQDPVNNNYKHYNLGYEKRIIDSDDNIVVVPETNVNLLRKIKHAKKIIWWMSVDNYFKSLKSKRNRLIDIFGLFKYNFKRDDIVHLVQSYYAEDFLLNNGIASSSIRYLSDYLDKEFIRNATNNELPNKKRVVLYNPKKGFEFTQKIIGSSPEIKYVPLVNLTPIQMSEILKSSMVYIDFGNHPGKDRIPREAAISGCCVITGKRGSAGFVKDVPIPNDYKFDDVEENIPLIINRINYIFNNFEHASKDFDEYRNIILHEEENFESDVKSVFSSL